MMLSFSRREKQEKGYSRLWATLGYEIKVRCLVKGNNPESAKKYPEFFI